MTSIVLGATGHVGSACARALLAQGEPVIAVVHAAAKAQDLAAAGAGLAEVDVGDVAALTAVLRRGERAFLLNPPADPAGDTDAEETRTAAAIADAARQAGLQRIVAASTYGAQPGEGIGDLSVLHAFEQRLDAIPTELAIDRGAYYFSNWDMSLASARDDGVVRTPYPADLHLPMVAPADLGRVAADRLLRSDDSGLRYVEGPEHYCAQDVADILADLLGRAVRVETVPADGWEQMFRGQGFSPASARAFTRMMQVSVEGGFEMPRTPIRGEITLRAYLTELVAQLAERPRRLDDRHELRDGEAGAADQGAIDIARS